MDLAGHCFLSLPRPVTWLWGNAGFDPDRKGFRVGYEEKYYFRRVSPDGVYMALEAEYLHSRGSGILTFQDVNGLIYNDTFGITKNNFYLNLKVGYHLSFNRIVIEFFGGLGVQYRNVAHNDRIGPNDQMMSGDLFSLANFYNKDGRSWNPHIPLSFRIGYLF